MSTVHSNLGNNSHIGDAFALVGSGLLVQPTETTTVCSATSLIGDASTCAESLPAQRATGVFTSTLASAPTSTSAPAVAATTVSTTASVALLPRSRGYPSMVDHQVARLTAGLPRQSGRSAPAPPPAPEPTTTITITTVTAAPPASPAEGSSSHPILQSLLSYARSYASGASISGGILISRIEAEAVLFALCYYREKWDTLHSAPNEMVALLNREFQHDITCTNETLAAVQTRLRAEGASDQLALAESIELLFDADLINIFSRCIARFEIRYNTPAFFADPPSASASPDAHAQFLSLILENCRDEVWKHVFLRRNKNVRRASLQPNNVALVRMFKDVRAYEQILSYICRRSSVVDSIGPGNYRQFMQLPIAEQHRLVWRMIREIEGAPLPPLEAALSDMSGGITSYLALSSSSSYLYRKFVAEHLLVQLIDKVANLWVFHKKVYDTVAFYKITGIKRLYSAIPRLQDQVKLLMEQFQRDGLFENLCVVETLCELLEINHWVCKNNLQALSIGVQNHSTSALSSTTPPTQNLPLYRGLNFLHFVARCQSLVLEQLQDFLRQMQEDSPIGVLLSVFVKARSNARLLTYLDRVRNHPAPSAPAHVPVATPPSTIPPAATTVSASTTTSSTTTIEPESPPPSTTTTTTTTTTATTTTTTTTTTVAVRSRPALAPALAPSKASREQTWENITLAELRRLNPQELLELFNAMKFSVVSGRGSHQKILDEAGHVVGVLPVHPKREGLSWPVAKNIYAAVKSGGKEKGGS